MKDLDQSNVGAEETPVGLFTTLDQALEAFDVALKDVADDFGDECSDEYAFDVAIGLAYDCTPAVARELCRTQLGFIPDALGFVPVRGE